MKRVLVTGASGFVGTHALPALLRRGFEVHAIGRTRPHHPDVAFHQIDLLDGAALVPLFASLRPSHLLHLAWFAEPGLYWRSPLNLDWIAASLTLIRKFGDAGGKRAVVAGTCAEYAWGPARLDEYAVCTPATLYGTAKDATRRVLDVYAREVDLSAAWGRLFFLYGPGERPGRLVSDAIRTLRAADPFMTTSGHQRRDFLHVTDAGAAFAMLVDSHVTGPVNIASGNAVPVRAIIDQLGMLLQRPELIRYGARALPLSEPMCIEADVSRLRDVVGFTPSYDLDQGLSDTVRRWQQRPLFGDNAYCGRANLGREHD